MSRTGDKKNRVQDVLVLISLLILATILILGLIPREQYDGNSVNSFFFNIVMVIPLVIAVYFIIISFRRRVSRDLHRVSTTIRTKLLLSLLFAAILPTLPITIISNNIISRALSELFNQDTQQSLDKALDLSREVLDGEALRLSNTAELFAEAVSAGLISVTEKSSYDFIQRMCYNQNISCKVYTISTDEYYNTVADFYGEKGDDFISEFLTLVNFDRSSRLYRINHEKETYILSAYTDFPYVVVFYKVLPQHLFTSVLNFEKNKVRYEQQTFIMPHVQNVVGVSLLILSVVIIIVSVGLSYFLAQSITRPIYTLVDASQKIAEGDFSLRLNRGASDEISLLFNSYNNMAERLNEHRKILMHNQRLEVWKEVGSKLFHEIKNPLTPIRLSAERIQRKYLEKPDNLDSIIKSGTDTIIEEVDMLRHILGEFSKYTRMPELKCEYHNINDLLKNCVEAFQGHEQVGFQLHLDETLPKLWIDRILIRQMMNNIVKNAIEAMGGAGTVFVRSGQTDNNCVIRIADTGPGINQRDIDRLFEASFSRKSDGTGLGLAIVERTIVKHGGTIRCVSAPGQGAEFIITLPIPRSEDGKSTDS